MENIRETLSSAIKDLYGLDFTPDLTPAPENIDADYSTNAPLKLAKDLHKNPMIIAEELERQFVSICDNGRERSGEQIAFPTPPGFLNFIVPDQALSDQISALATHFEQIFVQNHTRNRLSSANLATPTPSKSSTSVTSIPASSVTPSLVSTSTPAHGLSAPTLAAMSVFTSPRPSTS
ncbi:hypothetical protein IJG96_03080 [Candidatus Saccharibacteria bacterium]|nr:hypothetical protein [Candidatus Saccharibacteria bacterium]